MNAIKTKHNLDFEVAASPYVIPGYEIEHQMFRVGTCEGQWGSLPDSYFILSVTNNIPGNGHFTDVLQWFEFSSKRENKNLLILECINKEFYNHLITKRGFIPLDKGGENCIKVFNKNMYEQLKQKGNKILKRKSLECV